MSSYPPTQSTPFNKYIPKAQVMDSYGTDHDAAVFPSREDLRSARFEAERVKSMKLNPEVLESTYDDLDLSEVKSSRDITGSRYDHTIDRQTIFEDFLTPQFYREALRPKSTNKDDTIPVHVEDIKAHVALLVRAFKSTNNAEDNPSTINPFLQRKQDPKLVECICWNLMKACIMRAEGDEPLMMAYEPLKAKRNGPALKTFAQRFDAIVDALARSKTLSKHLFDAPFINNFVDDPVKSNKRVDGNRNLNKKKGETMAVGKEVLIKEGKLQPKLPKSKKRKGSDLDEDDSGDAAASMPSSTRVKRDTLQLTTPSRCSTRQNASAVDSEASTQYNWQTPMSEAGKWSSQMSGSANVKNEMTSSYGRANDFNQGPDQIYSPAQPFSHNVMQGSGQNVMQVPGQNYMQPPARPLMQAPTPTFMQPNLFDSTLSRQANYGNIGAPHEELPQLSHVMNSMPNMFNYNITNNNNLLANHTYGSRQIPLAPQGLRRTGAIDDAGDAENATGPEDVEPPWHYDLPPDFPFGPQ